MSLPVIAKPEEDGRRIVARSWRLAALRPDSLEMRGIRFNSSRKN
jgi:hypothetical protein